MFLRCQGLQNSQLLGGALYWGASRCGIEEHFNWFGCPASLRVEKPDRQWWWSCIDWCLKNSLMLSKEGIVARTKIRSRKVPKVKMWSGSLRQLSFLRVSLLTHDARVIQHSQQRPQFLLGFLLTYSNYFAELANENLIVCLCLWLIKR